MQDLIKKYLIKRKHSIIECWQNRMKQLLGDRNEQLTEFMVHQLYEALFNYFIESDLNAAINRLGCVTKTVSEKRTHGRDIVYNGLLISRYLLLAEIAKDEEKNVNSLSVFSQINDAYQPFVEKIFTHLDENIRELLPKDFKHVAELGLLSVDFAGIGLFLLDTNLNFIYWSQGMSRMYEMAEDVILGDNLVNVFPRIQNEKVYDSIIKAIRDGHESELSAVEYQTKYTDKRIVNFKVAPLRNTKSEVIGASILVDDITDQYHQRLRLKRYEQYIVNILNDAADAIIILDSEDKIVKWNHAAEALYGWSENEVIDKSISFIVPDDEESKREIQWISSQVREKGFIRNLKTQRITRTGAQIFIQITRTAIKNDNGDYIGSSVIARDITEQEKLREQLIHSEKLSAVGTLAAGIAHEIGAPLTAISSISQVLRNRTDDEYFAEKLKIIQESIDRISRTVRTLVDFSKPVRQKIENVYINSVIEHMIHIIKYDTRIKNYEISTELKGDLPQVKANFDQLLQVFINMALNAADALDGRENGKIHFKSWHEENIVYVSVEDNGCGISQNDIQHIFEPFFTTKKEGKGTGLGLWVSYNIIKSFSGNINVESQQGKGTMFKISLPCDFEE